MESRPIQKFQWALANEITRPRPTRSVASASLVTSVSTPPTSASKKARTASSSPTHKPYSTSTLWHPVTEDGDNPLKCFLTLTPQVHKPLASSLPLISFKARKQEDDPQNKKKFPYQISIDPEQHKVPKMKVFQPEPDLMVPAVPIRILSHNNDVNRRKPRLSSSVEDWNHSDGASFGSRVPKLPNVTPTSDYSNFNSSSVFNSPRSNKTSLTHHSMVPMVDTPRDGEIFGTEKVWSMPEFSSINPAWSVGLREQNDLDVGTLYSTKQSAFYSRIAREHTIVPSPSNCNRFLYDHVPNAECVKEKRYVRDNYHNKHSTPQRLVKDEIVFPEVYKSHLRKSKHQMSYLRSMLAKEEQKSKHTQIYCCRTNQSNESQHNHEPSTVQVPDENNNINGVMTENNNNYSRFSSQTQKADKLVRLNYWKSKQEMQDSVSRDTNENLNHTGSNGKDDPGWQDAVAAQFCDVLGKRSCHNCTDHLTKQYTKKVEETMTAENEFTPHTPPATPDEIGVTLPTQALHKVIIRVKDKEGVMAVASVGVNEDAISGL